VPDIAIPGSLQRLMDQMAEGTFRRFEHLWWDNTVANRPQVTRTVLEAGLKRKGADVSSALVVAHGPSLKRRNSLEAIRKSGYQGLIVAVDSAAAVCLRAGIVPDAVVSVDPRPRIVHNFGETEELTRLHPEDEAYYRARADESHLGADPYATSRENRDLMNRFGAQMIGLFSTAITPRTALRCREIGLDAFWFNPMYDDYDQPGSFTRKVHDLVPVPCLNAGGNVGTAAWVLAHSVLGARRVGLVGFDFAYYPGTSLKQTQYYESLVELFGEDGVADVLPVLPHPSTGERFFTDPAYLWFRQVFLEMEASAPCETVNCTEGGILYGGNIREMPLRQFLHETASAGNIELHSSVR